MYAWQNLRAGNEFLVIGKCVFQFHRSVTEQEHASAGLQIKAALQPYFVVQSHLINAESRSFMDTRKNQADTHRIDSFSLHFHPSVFLLINPYRALDFGEETRVGMLRME